MNNYKKSKINGCQRLAGVNTLPEFVTQIVFLLGLNPFLIFLEQDQNLRFPMDGTLQFVSAQAMFLLSAPTPARLLLCMKNK